MLSRLSPGGGDGSPGNPAGGALAAAAWRGGILDLRAHRLHPDAEGRWSVRDDSGRTSRTGRGEATRPRRQGPGSRPRRGEAARCPGRGRWGSGDRGWPAGGRGWERGAGHAFVGGTRAGRVRLRDAGTPGRRACCRYARVPDGGDTGFSLGHGASGAGVERPLVTRPEPGVDFPTKTHQGHCSLLCKVAWLWGNVSLERNAIGATAGADPQFGVQ